jgi:hypothetical protein
LFIAGSNQELRFPSRAVAPNAGAEEGVNRGKTSLQQNQNAFLNLKECLMNAIPLRSNREFFSAILL